MKCIISKQTVTNVIFVGLKKNGMPQTKFMEICSDAKNVERHSAPNASKINLGGSEYYRMMQGFDLICCPDCFEKYYKKGGEIKCITSNIKQNISMEERQ